VHRGAGALVVGTTPWAIERRHKILTLATHHNVPAIYPFSTFVFEGGLMSYGVGRGVFRQVAAHYVGKILKGAKPADLPIQQPAKFEFMILIGLSIARADLWDLGAAVQISGPLFAGLARTCQSLLARTDEVIE
jgi:ABC-type uncharacterized transport system substrate-binding protein